MHNQRRNIPGIPKRRRQAVQRGLALDNVMRQVLELADRVARRLLDVHRGSAKVAAAQVRELAALPADEVDPALDGADDGREDAVLGGWAAEVVADEVAGVLVDVEAVRDVVSVESKRFTGDGDGYMLYPSMLVKSLA